MKTLREYIDLVNSLSLLEWAPTPEQAKWLGGANQQDPYIMSRMPGPKPPVTWFTDPADQEIARRAKFPETEPAAAPAAAPAPAAVATPVPEPTKIEPTPLAPTPAPSKPASGQGAKPAGPNPVMTLQQKLIALGADIKADGIMGPKTQAAMKQYGLNADGTSIAKNVSAPGQPPATLMKDTPAGQLQTDAARAAKRASDKDPTGTSLNSRVTVAQPTGAIAPTAINKGSGVGKNATLDPAQASAAVDALKDPNVSAADKAFLNRMLANTNATAPTATSNVAKPAPAQAPVQQQAAPVQQQAAPPAKVSPRPANMRSREAAEWNKQFGATHDPRTGAALGESVGYNELDRIVSLVHYR